jgi:type VI secretion system protein ImpK
MTPKFAHAVDPIMLHILSVLDRIAREERLSPQDERLRIRTLIDQAEAMLGSSQDWQLAKYAICSWADEMLVDAPWDGRDWWSNNVLEVEIFNTRTCYEQFYERAKEASSLTSRDALEVYYVCVVLGFRGVYRDPELAIYSIQNLGLPPDVESWAKQASMSVRLGQGRPQMNGKRKEISGAPPQRGRMVLLWSGLSMILVAAVSVVYLFYG